MAEVYRLETVEFVGDHSQDSAAIFEQDTERRSHQCGFHDILQLLALRGQILQHSSISGPLHLGLTPGGILQYCLHSYSSCNPPV